MLAMLPPASCLLHHHAEDAASRIQKKKTTICRVEEEAPAADCGAASRTIAARLNTSTLKGDTQ